MNKSTVNRLLSKKSWTGAEIGKLMIANLINDGKMASIQQEYTPLFNQEKLNEMVSKLKEPKDLLDYRIYTEIYNLIVDTFNIAQGQYQQFMNGYYRLFSELNSTRIYEDMLQAKSNTPLVLTQKEYDERAKKTTEQKKAFKDSLIDIIFSCIEACIEPNRLTDQPKVQAILDALEPLKGEPITDTDVIEYYDGSENTDRTKYNALSYYWTDEVRAIEGEAKVAYYKDFKKEYPTLAKAVEEYTYSKLPQAKKLKGLKTAEPAYTWGELADINFLGYKYLLENITEFDISETYEESSIEREQAISGGIAILTKSTEGMINRIGFFEKKLFEVQSLWSLEKLDKGEKTLIGYREELIYPALSYMYAFNAFLGILEKVYDIKGLAEGLKVHVEEAERQAENYNGFLELTKETLYSYSVDNLKHKEALLDHYHRPIEPALVQVDPQKVTEIRKQLEEIGMTERTLELFRIEQTLKNKNNIIFNLQTVKGATQWRKVH